MAANGNKSLLTRKEENLQKRQNKELQGVKNAGEKEMKKKERKKKKRKKERKERDKRKERKKEKKERKKERKKEGKSKIKEMRWLKKPRKRTDLVNVGKLQPWCCDGRRIVKRFFAMIS